MEIGNKIKNLRTKNNISQEQLAERIYVTRQTISSWENDKSYPDINSLIRISEIFNITVDELVKGDIVKMKEIIREEDINKFQKESKIFKMIFLLMIVSAPFLIYFLGTIGALIWALIVAVVIFYALRVEELKKNYDLSSIREIDAFLRGEKLDQIEKKVEKGKSPYQTFLLAITAGIVASLLFISIIKLLEQLNI